MEFELKSELIKKYKKKRAETLKQYHSIDFQENSAIGLKLRQIQLYLELLEIDEKPKSFKNGIHWEESFQKELYQQVEMRDEHEK